MRIDLTYPLKKEELINMIKISGFDTAMDKFGHFGTHLDCMNKEFPLHYCRLNGVIIDSRKANKEIKVSDIDFSNISMNDFVIFYTGIMEKYKYGSQEYLSYPLEFSDELIKRLTEEKIRIAGIDMAGVKLGQNHAKADQYLANHNIFVFENLYNINSLFKEINEQSFIVNTFPLKLEGYTGLPTRVIAEI
jgi:kynurenine formamidase